MDVGFGLKFNLTWVEVTFGEVQSGWNAGNVKGVDLSTNTGDSGSRGWQDIDVTLGANGSWYRD